MNCYSCGEELTSVDSCNRCWSETETELKSEIERLRKVDATAKEIVELVFSATDNEATECPFWYVAAKAGLGRTAILSDGVWFSREAAEEHMRKKAHRYSKNAFVYCDSAHASYGGLRELYRLAEELRKSRGESK